MTDAFKDREKGFETKYKLDQELEFKAMARRNKLLGLWAAEQFGLSGDAAEEYAKSVVVADFEESGDDDVLQKVLADFEQHGVEMSDHRLRKHMDELLETARAQVKAES